MSEESDIDSPQPLKNYTPLKRFGITSVIFILMLIVLSQVLPHLLFDNSAHVETEKTSVKVSSSPQMPSENIPETLNFIPASPEPLPSVYKEQKDNKVAELELKIAALQQEHQKEISELKSKFAEENSQVQNRADALVSSLVVFDQLKLALKSGGPYKTELSHLQKLAGSRPPVNEILTELEENAENGIINLAALKARFPKLVNEALSGKEERIGFQLLHKFITIRKIGNRSGDDDESIFARAEVKLAEGDLRDVLKELNSLSSVSKETLASWMADSEKWLEYSAKLDILQAILSETQKALQP